MKAKTGSGQKNKNWVSGQPESRDPCRCDGCGGNASIDSPRRQPLACQKWASAKTCRKSQVPSQGPPRTECSACSWMTPPSRSTSKA
jgi:hypothetical protein